MLATALLLGAVTSAPASAVTGYDSTYAGQSAFLTLAPGETGTFTVFFLNSGTVTWVKGTSTQVDLAACQADKVTCNSQDATDSPFNSGWLTATRYATAAQTSVAPGAIANFSYSVKPPFGTIQGIYRFNGELVLAQTGEKIHPEGYFQDALVTASVARIEITPATEADEVNVSQTFTATYFNASGTAVSGVPIDIFVVRDASPFTSGACSRAIQALPNSTGTDPCKIDDADPVTDSAGKVSFSWAGTLEETQRVIAWTGVDGTTYSSTASLTQGAATMTWYGAAGGLAISPATKTNRFAGTHTATSQLVDGDGDPLAVSGLNVIWQVFRGGSDAGVTCTGGTAVEVQTVATDATGKSTFSYTGPPDPSVAFGNTTTDCVFSFYDRTGSGIRESSEPADAVLVNWGDAVAGSTPALTVTTSGTGLDDSASVTVTLALRDLYADPIGGKPITLNVSRTKADTYVRQNQGIVIATTLTADSAGNATYTYNGPGFGATDTVDACADMNVDGDCTDAEDVSLTEVADKTVQWTNAATSSTTTRYVGRVLICDTAARTLYVYVLSGPATGNLRFTYDTSDVFFLDSDGVADDSIDGSARTLAVWEDKCAVDDALVISYNAGGSSQFENESKTP